MPSTTGICSKSCRRPPSDGLELLEGLAALGAVVDGAAEGRTEGVVENGPARAAVGARCRRRKLDQDAGRARRCEGRREARLGETLSALGCDSVARPRRLEGDLDLDLGIRGQILEALPDPDTHCLEGRTTDERGQDLDLDGVG